MQLKIFFKSFPETSKCPSCGKIGTIRRSRARNTLENVWKFSGIVNLYKCRGCGWRGVMKRFTVNKYSFITMMFYIALVLLAAYIITSVLKKNFE